MSCDLVSTLTSQNRECGCAESGQVSLESCQKEYNFDCMAGKSPFKHPHIRKGDQRHVKVAAAIVLAKFRRGMKGKQ